MKPLDGVIVLDLTRYLAGPYCTLLLAGLGANVIRVESTAGDPYRDRPPFAGAHGMSDTRRADGDMPYTILHRARGKKSITLNLRAPRGVELFKRLCAHADVVAENYLPGTMEKMGLAFPVLHALNARLILCSISGFGQRGPYRDWRAFDPIVQAMSGMSSITGYPDRPPVRCGAAISDTTASLFGVIGILSALRARERTGRGDWVDVAMMDGSFFLLADILELVAAGEAPERRGNGHPGTVPFNVYRARDGWVSVCAVTAEEWRHVLAAMNRPELAADPRFDGGVTNRQEHRAEIDTLVGDWMAAHTVDEAVALLQKHHVPAGPVRDLREAFDDAQLRAREMVVPLTHPLYGAVPGARGVGMPIKFQHHPAGFDSPAPVAGAHNEEIYGRLLGLSADELAKLRIDGVI
jgi:crotonobetainyl-CoA:carnitine CoA-transferase CaiB-like acyl-CoA transferase